MTPVTDTTAPVLAIDGPSGTGKGTIAGRVARHLGWQTLDSGALYRAFAFLAVENSIDPGDAEGLEALSQSSVIQFVAELDGVKILVGDRDITDEVRSESGGRNASVYAKVAVVRKALLRRQRSMRRPPGLVADGRDMGTVVFPDAFLKVFLDASPAVRAQRRYKQLKGKGFDVTLRALEREIAERDDQDRNRAVSPLVPAADAIVLDTSEKDIGEVFAEVMQFVNEQLDPEKTPRS
ncbi:MAG TPA: (d)CMP kinase [Gammaproteobacteria bacterium]|nr:(d)CMP kinase [Arenicellales bacterium]MDP6551500.1 (d)CMP kinase [Arenicellales bacterium]MDP6790986.1 (d)CMP kinase [Arenicellales bacterium]MDP6918532.1 (d)CMP kinase [Arenicellales bacterium]HCX87626.1 (d)CMP kinase [Gammaproteobacteria bacterium]